MVCSDNMVRAGLTNKFKDVNTLTDMLTYISKSAKDQKLVPQVVDDFTKTYVTPVPEFVVNAIEVNGEHVRLTFEYKLIRKESGSIFIVICGDAKCSGTKVFAGFFRFIPALTSLVINNLKPLLLYRAYCRLN